jgi:hypothetical protein
LGLPNSPEVRNISTAGIAIPSIRMRLNPERAQKDAGPSCFHLVTIKTQATRQTIMIGKAFHNRLRKNWMEAVAFINVLEE